MTGSAGSNAPNGAGGGASWSNNNVGSGSPGTGGGGYAGGGAGGGSTGGGKNGAGGGSAYANGTYVTGATLTAGTNGGDPPNTGDPSYTNNAGKPVAFSAGNPGLVVLTFA